MALARRVALRGARRFASLHALSEDEELLRSSAERFAKEVLAPRVAEMDRSAAMPSEVVAALFEQGLMGIEVPSDMGGVDMNFTAACLAIEEVAKVDPAVSALMDRIRERRRSNGESNRTCIFALYNLCIYNIIYIYI